MLNENSNILHISFNHADFHYTMATSHLQYMIHFRVYNYSSLKKVACFLFMFASQSSFIHFYTVLEKTFTFSKLKVAIIHLHGPYLWKTSVMFVDICFLSNLQGRVALMLAVHFIYHSMAFTDNDLHHHLKIGTETIFLSSIQLLTLLLTIVFLVGS